MKLKLLETVQGRDVSGVLLETGATVTVLEEGQAYEVSASLGAWLLENKKAEVYKEEKKSKHYGAQAEPELRHDEEIYKELTEEPVSDMMTTESAKPKTKRGKK